MAAVKFLIAYPTCYALHIVMFFDQQKKAMKYLSRSLLSRFFLPGALLMISLLMHIADALPSEGLAEIENSDGDSDPQEPVGSHWAKGVCAHIDRIYYRYLFVRVHDRSYHCYISGRFDGSCSEDSLKGSAFSFQISNRSPDDLLTAKINSFVSSERRSPNFRKLYISAVAIMARMLKSCKNDDSLIVVQGGFGDNTYIPQAKFDSLLKADIHTVASIRLPRKELSSQSLADSSPNGIPIPQSPPSDDEERYF